MFRRTPPPTTSADLAAVSRALLDLQRDVQRCESTVRSLRTWLQRNGLPDESGESAPREAVPVPGGWGQRAS